MNDIVIMPKDDWVSALDVVRNKSGDNVLIKSGELAGKLQMLLGNNTMLNTLLDRSITKIEHDTEVIGSYAFAYCANLSEVVLNKAKMCNMNAFQNCTSLETISLPELHTLSNNVFVSCNVLKNCNFPKVTSIGGLCFRYCASLAKIHLPSATTISAQAFQNCNMLTTVRIDKPTTINNLSFGQSPKFSALVLTSSSNVSTLANTTAFNGTLIASGTGYVYVPRSLIDSYKSATNWSTYADQFRAIEDYPNILNL